MDIGKNQTDTSDIMRQALETSMQAIDDWINIYAPDMCHEERVAEARERVFERYGLLGHLAAIQDANRAALNARNLQPAPQAPSPLKPLTWVLRDTLWSQCPVTGKSFSISHEDGLWWAAWDLNLPGAPCPGPLKDEAERLRAEIVAPHLAAAPVMPKPEQVDSACLSFRHDYGLLEDGEKDRVRFEAIEWFVAWVKEFEHLSWREVPLLRPTPDREDQLEALKAEIAHKDALLEERYSDIRLVSFEGGSFTFSSPILPLLTEFMAQMLQPDQTEEAANYTETEVTHNHLGALTLTLQRVSGKTPHQLRKQAEARLSALVEVLQAHLEADQARLTFGELTANELILVRAILKWVLRLVDKGA